MLFLSIGGWIAIIVVVLIVVFNFSPSFVGVFVQPHPMSVIAKIMAII